jgi:predicted ATPase/DNA-binding winged helix-turn-helix (wHTH) protein
MPVPVGERAFDIIEVLVEASGELVSKDELMRRVWTGVVVGENTLHAHISAVRKAFGSDREMLKTTSGRGYRLVGPWTAQADNAPAIAVTSESPGRPRESFHSNLPAAASDLIGRSRDIERLGDLLSAHRVVTLTGPGGIGKTTLALEAARNLLRNFRGDAWFVDLVSLADPVLVPSAVAGVLGLTLATTEISSRAVALAIGDKKTLILLDNCEHVIDAAAGLAETIVRLCPGATVLATSREVLRIEGEYAFRVLPLEVPSERGEEAHDLLGHSAVQLFVARTSASDRDLLADGEDLPVIGAICRRLDGIPLAIEFAAARAATLGLQQVAARLDDRFALLSGGRRTAVPRHQTLRATIDWSYELLSEEEQSLLRHLAVFPAGFTLEAATAVMSDTGRDGLSVMEGIASLVGKSFVMLDGPASVSRWRLLETIRSYAREKLDASGERNATARRHAQYFCSLSERAEFEWETVPTNEWLSAYQGHLDDIRIALDWAFSDNGDTALGVALTVAALPLWFQLSLINECRGRVERALASVRSPPERGDTRAMKLHAARGWSLMYTPGEARETGAAWAFALQLAEQNNDIDYHLRAMWGLWAGNINNGRFSDALALARRFDSLASAEADEPDCYIGDRLIGVCLHFLGDQHGARRHIDRMLARYVTPASRSDAVRFQFDQRVTARYTLSRVLWLQGFPDHALRVVQESIDHALSTDHILSLCNNLAQAACPVALLAGALPQAERFTSMLLEQTERHALQLWHHYGNCFAGELLIRSGKLDAGLPLLKTAVNDLRKARFVQYYTSFLIVLAESLGRAGQVAEGTEAIDDALARSEANEERWCLPEILRVKGMLLAQTPGPDAAAAAEVCYGQSLEWAQRQGALSWELRTAVSLASLRLAQNRPNDARKMLASVRDRFTEGFETADLLSATALIESLGWHDTRPTR